MKKSYNKPAMYIENFELSEHVAAGCNSQNVIDGYVPPKDPTFRNKEDCSFDIDGMSFFADGNVNCTAGDITTIEGDNGCYQLGTMFLSSLNYFFS